MTSKATNAKLAINTTSLDELQADYQAAIERNERETQAYRVCVALLLVALITTYLGYVGTLPWFGVICVCLGLLTCGVTFIRSARRDGVLFGGGV